MVEQQDFSDINSDVDVFRDTALRYLGEYCIHCKVIMTIVRPAVDSFFHQFKIILNCKHELLFQCARSAVAFTDVKGYHSIQH